MRTCYFKRKIFKVSATSCLKMNPLWFGLECWQWH
ncbi:hypothetical protein T4A_8815 [Trichinella pseudospiralis]|uniref:Uncharacterized protein n=1 Tax=Trichinella pseudospiralis TaxID=6337 RepID=A0A0V1CUL4_TRIPS|nr:hypothetical protein T4A_8815 [Trichinella pseudospiralis]